MLLRFGPTDRNRLAPEYSALCDSNVSKRAVETIRIGQNTCHSVVRARRLAEEAIEIQINPCLSTRGGSSSSSSKSINTSQPPTPRTQGYGGADGGGSGGGGGPGPGAAAAAATPSMADGGLWQ